MTSKRRNRWAHARCAYRVRYRHAQWVGKADPSGFGLSFIYSNDPSWLHEQALKLKAKGCSPVAIESREPC